MVRTKSNTSHLLNNRMYGSLLFNRDHSFVKKTDAEARAKALKKQGLQVRVHKSPTEAYHYTTYYRKKKPDDHVTWAMNRVRGRKR